MLPMYIQVSAGDELNKVAEGFNDGLGFPQCAIVDGTYIPVVSPEE